MEFIKQKKFLLASLALLVLTASLAGVFYYRSQYDKNLKNPPVSAPQDEAQMGSPPVERSNAATSSAASDEEAYQQALAGGYEKCAAISDSRKKDFCYSNIAVNKPDSGICENISEETVKNNCVKMTVAKLAKTARDPEKCLEIPDKPAQDICAFNIFTDLRTGVQACGQARNEWRDLCLNQAYSKEAADKKDINICQKIKDSGLVWECVYEFISSSIDTGICRPLSVSLKDKCFDIISYNLAVARLNKKICANIKNQETRADCLTNIDDIADYDQDGLTDAAEKKYGTNPNKKDTDSDGFSDGDEVKKGFNPLGAGKSDDHKE